MSIKNPPGASGYQAQTTKNAEVAPTFKSKHKFRTKGWYADNSKFWSSQCADLLIANESLAEHAKEAEIDATERARFRQLQLDALITDKASLEKNVTELTVQRDNKQIMADEYMLDRDIVQADLDKALRIIGQLTLEASHD
jgi:hypothetical protein